MKKTNKIFSWLMVGAFALSLIANASGQTVKERTAKVARIKGSARYSTGNNVWQPLQVGTVLRGGTIVQTAADSFVDVVLNQEAIAGSPAPATAAPPTPPSAPSAMMNYSPNSQQDVVRVFADTVLGIDKLTAVDTGADEVTETELDLRSGQIMGSVKKQAAASRYEVKVPNGVAGIRGTVYVISADGVVSVLVGSVVLAYTKSDGTVVTQVVTAGNQFDSRTGALTPIPKSRLGDLFRIAQDASVRDLTRPTSMAVDNTIQYISPITN
jgi:hypothetical protein